MELSLSRKRPRSESSSSSERPIKFRVDGTPVYSSSALVPMDTSGSRNYRFTRYTRRYRSSGSAPTRIGNSSQPTRYGGSGYRRYPNTARNRGPYAQLNSFSPELKYIDADTAFIPIGFGDVTDLTPANQYSINTGATEPYRAYTGSNLGGWIACVSAPPLGQDANTRIGQRIRLKSVRLTATWRIMDTPGQANLSTQPVSIRTALIWDKCPNGVRPNLSAIYKPVIHIGNPYVMPRSPNNLENRDRFVTLMDINDTLNPGGDALRMIDRYVKIKDGNVTFNSSSAGNNYGWSTDGTVINQGALYLVFSSDATDTTSTTFTFRPIVQYTCRTRYYDC